jgi:hypothetical protein
VANDFHSSLKRSDGFSAGKAGKRMVNIDDFIFVKQIKFGVMICM